MRESLTNRPWSLVWTGFQKETQAQTESIFCQGNGRLCARDAVPLPCTGRTVGTFASGVYDAFADTVSELVHLPDMLGLRLWVDGVELTMESCRGATRTLRMDGGSASAEYSFDGLTLWVERFASLADKRLLVQRVRVTAERPRAFRVLAQLDGQTSNSGAQHLAIGTRLGRDDLWRMDCRTVQSEIPCALAAAVQTNASRAELSMRSRSVGRFYELTGSELRLTQYGAILTGAETAEPDARATAGADNAFAAAQAPLAEEGARRSTRSLVGDVRQAAQALAFEAEALVRAARDAGFDALRSRHENAWAAYWRDADMQLDSENPADQTAIRFALYHLRAMTPDSPRMNIGAKGLSGEAYKGHTFWDTEMFLLDPWLAIDPETAGKLVRYRIASLPAAREKARRCGYAGAMFPWESARPQDGEMTPDEGEPDVVTGKPIPIRTGRDEIHVTADVAFGLWRYVRATGDTALLAQGGGDVLREAALFWATRAEWIGQNARYELRDVIGPDEYSEHADNNAYTNLLAHWTMTRALALHLLAGEEEALVQRVADGLYLPAPDERGVIAQSDGWTSLPELDLSPYKGKPASILKRYNVDELGGYQAAKQADVVAYLSLFPDAYPPETVAANLDYYEPRCLHDSSLSYATYAVVAARLGRTEQAYRFFAKAAEVDKTSALTSAEGIHAAAMGGIWQCVAQGFAGLSVEREQPTLRPHLPKQWKRLAFTCACHGRRYRVCVEGNEASVQPIV